MEEADQTCYRLKGGPAKGYFWYRLEIGWMIGYSPEDNMGAIRCRRG